MGAAQVETDGENITKAGRGERTRQPQADLNQPKAGKCAKGAQASEGGLLYPPLAGADLISSSSSHLRPWPDFKNFSRCLAS